MSILATDSFAGGNASPPNGNWTNSSGYGGLRTISNELACVSSGDSSAFYTGVSFPNDQYSQLKVVATSTSNDGGPAVRGNPANGDCAFLTNFDNASLYMVSLIGGSFNLEGSSVSGNYATNDVYRVEAEGTTYRVKLGGSTIMTQSFAGLTSGSAGAFIFDPTLRFDEFEGGDFNTGATLSPTAISSAAVFGSHTVVKMSFILPTAVASAAVYGSHTVVTMKFISPTAVGSAAAFGSHTIVKEVDSSGIPSAAEYGSQTVVKDGQTLTVTGIASAATYGSHTLSQVGQSLLPTAVGTAAVYGSHTVADVNLQIEPGGIASAAVYGAHVVATAGTQVVSPTGIGSAVAYGSHAVGNATPQAVSPVAVASAAVYGSNTVGLVLETIIVPGIGTAGQVGRPTLIGGISPTEFYIGSSNVTIDDRVEEDRPIGAGNVQQPLGDLE